MNAEIGGYPAANAVGATLTPGTKYVYWVVQQAGETDEATTVNEYSASDLANWLAGTGTITANGFASSSNVGTNDYAAWVAGTTGTKYAGDPTDPTTIPGSIVNPDYACVLNTTIAANTNSTWAAELAAGKVPLAAGTSTINGTAVPDGVASASASGSFTATSGQQSAEQGPCVAFYGGNSTNFYTSAVGTFTTPPLGKIVVAGTGLVARRKAVVVIADRSVERAAGTIVLSAKKGHRTISVASGSFSVPSGAKGTASLRLTSAGAALFAKSSKLLTKVTVTSTTDQPSSGRTVRLK